LTSSYGDGVVCGETIDLTIAKQPKLIAGGWFNLTTLNGLFLGSLVRIKEGQSVKINVKKSLKTAPQYTGMGLSCPTPLTAFLALRFLELRQTRRSVMRLMRNKMVLTGITATELFKNSSAT